MSIRIRNKNKPHKKLLEEPNQLLWKEAETEEIQIRKKIVLWSQERVRYLCEQLTELKEKYGEDIETDLQYYKLRDELVNLCQKGYLGLGLFEWDKEWINEGLTCLLNLYDPLISKIATFFVKKKQDYGNNQDYDETKSYTQQFFMRLITGDTPWAIKAFMSEEPTQETKAGLSEIRVKRKRQEWEQKYDDIVRMMEDRESHPNDIKITKNLTQVAKNNFPNWVNQQVMEFKDWAKWILYHQIRMREIWLELGLIIDNARIRRIKKDIERAYAVLTKPELFNWVIKHNGKFLDKEYEVYRKTVYSDEKFKNYQGANFTAYISRYLRLRLADLYKRKELINRPNVSLDTVEQKDIPVAEEDFLHNLTEESWQKFYSKLTEKEQGYITLKVENYKPVDIAKRLGISKGRISQISNNVKQKAIKSGLFC